jgi:hypothetical protein
VEEEKAAPPKLAGRPKALMSPSKLAAPPSLALAMAMALLLLSAAAVEDVVLTAGAEMESVEGPDMLPLLHYLGLVCWERDAGLDDSSVERGYG